MSDPDFHPAGRIEALELDIEELSDQIARSRRLTTAGRVASVAGPLLLLALILGPIAFSPARVLAGLALMIGGIVLMGSSKSSTEELQRSLWRAERDRDAAIDALGLAPAENPEARPSGRVIPWRSRTERP